MAGRVELLVSPEESQDLACIKRLVCRWLHLSSSSVHTVRVLRRSVDGRSKQVMIRLLVEVYSGEDVFLPQLASRAYRDVTDSHREVLIVGAGPSGLFAALRCLERGLKPIVLERGKPVEERKRDVAQLSAKGVLNGESNYCFGEGGAGTFSDGKLYTRSNKRGDVSAVLKTFVDHGANEDILVETHAHIGSDRLPMVVSNIRKTILSHGGEIRFNTQVCDFQIVGNRITGVFDQHRTLIPCQDVVLCTGHSASDIYEWFDRNHYRIEAKPFALGVRIEHPQALINRLQYRSDARNPFLGAASYSFTAQVGGRGVFSFCMCPGGMIIPASTEDKCLVVNGMSNSQRSSPYANSGIVVGVDISDYADYASFGALSGLRFRTSFERRFFQSGGGDYRAPAQRMVDFVAGKTSTELNESSYFRGLNSVDFNRILPDFVAHGLRKGFAVFDQKKRGFLTNEAMLIGLESRTSSPVRIPRTERYHHPELINLYPCGEGAGYSGGITSSALDGVAVMDAIALTNEQ